MRTAWVLVSFCELLVYPRLATVVTMTTPPVAASKGSEDKPPSPKRTARVWSWKKPKDKVSADHVLQTCWSGTFSLAHLEAQPGRNLSAYNYYFKLKRQQILDQGEASATTTDKEPSSSQKLGFAGLARTVAEQWKSLGQTDPKLKQACEQMAALDKTRYKLELEEWHATKHAGATASEDVSGLVVDLSIASLLPPDDTSVVLAHNPAALPADPSSTEMVSGTEATKETAFSAESNKECSVEDDAIMRRPSSLSESMNSVPPSKSADTAPAMTTSLKPIDQVSPKQPAIGRDDTACMPSQHSSNPDSFPPNDELSDSSVLFHQREASTNDDERCPPRTKRWGVEAASNVPCCEPTDGPEEHEHLGYPQSNELDPLPLSQGLSHSSSHYDLDILYSLARG
jgi:hypothetical protein